jgi:hypothetical protein
MRKYEMNWVSPPHEKINYRHKLKMHLQRMAQTCIPLQAYIHHPSGRKDAEESRERWKET